MQCKMFIAVNSTSINFKKIVFDIFRSPHNLHHIAALNYKHLSIGLFHYISKKIENFYTQPLEKTDKFDVLRG